METNNLIYGLALGFVPYRIESRSPRRGVRILEIQAIFWSLTVHHRRRTCDWTLRLPLIDRLRHAAWAALNHIRGDDSEQA